MKDLPLPPSRRLASAIVAALRSHHHIVVGGGSHEALVQELDRMMADPLGQIRRRLVPREVHGEVTSTFGNDAVDEAVEELVAAVLERLMESDHVEDVFAEDLVMRRDVFRVVRDTLQALAPEETGDEDEEEAPRSVRLPELGYVAKQVVTLAETETLEDALSRAAEAAGTEFVRFDPSTQEAEFEHPDASADAGLRRAICDELEELVEWGFVDLPVVERTLPLEQDLTADAKKGNRAGLEALAEYHLRRGGVTASWDYRGPSSILVSFTPRSEEGVADLDERVAGFHRGAVALLAKGTTGPTAAQARQLRSATKEDGKKVVRSPAATPPAPEGKPRAPRTSKSADKAIRTQSTPKTTTAVKSPTKAGTKATATSASPPKKGSAKA